MSNYELDLDQVVAPPRVVVIGLASCFGCQIQITNMEAHLLDVLGQIDLAYWQLAMSEPLPERFDVAVIEGAVTTEESERLVRRLREQAGAVITIGACANTGGIPGIAAEGFEERAAEVYQNTPDACGEMIVPRSVTSVIDVDFSVQACPIDPEEFVQVLCAALYGSNATRKTRTMCGDCKLNENACFYDSGTMCLGLVTLAGCGARCVDIGRPCNGCRGLSPDANLESARAAVERYQLSVEAFDQALEMFNQTNPCLKTEG